MTCILPLVRKAWEKEECFMAHELGFIPHVIKGHSVDGGCLLSGIFFPSRDISVRVPVSGLCSKILVTEGLQGWLL